MNIREFISNLLTRKKHPKISDNEAQFASKISELVGFKIQNIELYREAFSLKNLKNRQSLRKNYERLEFLGDAILGSIISYELFQKYPHKNEGYLTQMKSKIVSRKNLNKVGDRLGLTKLIQNQNLKKDALGQNISGNLLEALIGAIYLDTHYKTCEKVVNKWLLNADEISLLEEKVMSYKSLLLEWSQKHKISIKYETTEEIIPKKGFHFHCIIWVNNEKIAETQATETSKKRAEEKAARITFEMLNAKENERKD